MSKKIFLSPSNQSDNTYAYGDTNEAAVCGQIAKATEKALKRCGFEVKTMQWETAQARCKESDAWGADLHVPIHTNAYNGKVAGTRLFVYKTSGEAYEAAKDIFNELAPLTPGTSENIQSYPGLIELKNPKAPSVYIEVDFHDNKEVAKWLVENTDEIGEAICKGICKHYESKFVEDLINVITEGKELPAHYDTAKAGTYTVNTSNGLFFRKGPSTDSKSLDLFEAGTQVVCLGHYTGDWLYVETVDNRVGFCHSDYLTKS